MLALTRPITFAYQEEWGVIAPNWSHRICWRVEGQALETPAWMGDLTHRRTEKLKVNDINTHFVDQGTGPTVLLLHGFPEFWNSWRCQIPALAEAGYHVIAPDVRGCGETEAPSDAVLYTTLHVTGGLVCLLNELMKERVRCWPWLGCRHCVGLLLVPTVSREGRGQCESPVCASHYWR